jgi:hypothetical protein
LILLGDGATPTEAFVAPCALTTKGIEFGADTNDFNVPDCDDPDAPTFTERVVATLSATINGAGTLAMESFDTWRQWFDSGLEKNIQFKLDAPLADNGGHWTMSAILSAFGIGAEQGGLATIDVTIQSNGAWIWTPAVA